MMVWLRQSIVPAYLLLCLLVGGSAQAIIGNAVLQLLGLAILVWAAIAPATERSSRASRQLGWLVVIALGLVAIQLVPLPEFLWSSLPGRAAISDGFEVLGVAPGWMPISLAPYDGMATVLAVIPPLAILAAVLRLRHSPPRWIAIALLAGTLGGIMLGVLQATSPDVLQSPWYLYRYSNFGIATGFFANSNHMASLLVVSIPFVVALASAASVSSEDPRKRLASLAIGLGGLVLLLVGLMINTSLAGFGLAVPVTIASVLLILKPRQRWVRTSGIAMMALSVVAFLAVIATPLSQNFESSGSATSVATRQAMLEGSVDAIRAYGPVGTGLGTFRNVFATFEDPSAVDQTYVNHAHDDYLELLVEFGLPGLFVIGLFLAWWAAAARQVVRSPAYDHFAAAGLIGSAAVLIHSLVDYPLRTAAMSSVFAACLALMLTARHSATSADDLRPTRHVVID